MLIPTPPTPKELDRRGRNIDRLIFRSGMWDHPEHFAIRERSRKFHGRMRWFWVFMLAFDLFWLVFDVITADWLLAALQVFMAFVALKMLRRSHRKQRDAHKPPEGQ